MLPTLTLEEVGIYGLCIQTVAIVASAIGVIVTVLWSARTAKRRATLDLVLAEESDPALIEQRTNFVRLRDAGHLVQYADPAKTTSDESAIIRATLNRYELVAIGVSNGIIDTKIYKLWCRSTLVKDWIACRPFAIQLRQDSRIADYFCAIESLAKKWAKGDERNQV